MNLNKVLFRRRFSVNLYRNLRLPMGEMNFHKNWADDRRGDPYPLLNRLGNLQESVGGGVYRIASLGENAFVKRLLGSFFPWNTYEIKLSELQNASVGFFLNGEGGTLSVLLNEHGAAVRCAEAERFFQGDVKQDSTFALTFRTGGISLYLDGALLGDLSLKMMHVYRKEEIFSHATVALDVRLQAGGGSTIDSVTWYLCGGISHADIKPIRYEDGTPMMENGRIFLTLTSRLEAEMYQSVISWNPTLCDFRMEGAIFYDCGDGYWCSDVASSILFDRPSGKWLIWMCAFSHGHVLGRGMTLNDPRFGIQVIDVKLMELAKNDERTAFLGFAGDEDPDLLYLDGKWHLAVCRSESGTGYHYYHFVSDQPLDGFTYADRTPTGEKTGGMFVKTDDGYAFVCGSDFSSRARYDVYSIDDFSDFQNLQCDYDDGGFRGWGTVMLLPFGNRKKYVWITFDRHNASSYNWSYGNLYVFDSDYIHK
ncbi:MAG: hypothetical protein IJW92_02010 [Clostridia bacterium]|nr:hypothetical protein [Clostridia bacterium]